ncbi:hypothetical protein E2C01_067224 [Portunus trituberculatus]|uniref:Uncharacterized protein n=1 Tax=Portunus trituberculatus TaxID=210409 RepID=A0A5B7HJ85_PORTR|nr:hypothetical protein [Portunus trituberculatus]
MVHRQFQNKQCSDIRRNVVFTGALYRTGTVQPLP